MRALTLTQPWASLVALGAKKLETRGWPTRYRGPLAIHAAKGWSAADRALVIEEPFARALGGDEVPVPGELPRGAILAMVDLVECYRTEQLEDVPFGEHEIDFGNFADGRFFFVLANLRRLPEPVPCKGALGIWAVPEATAELVERQILGGGRDLRGRADGACARGGV